MSPTVESTPTSSLAPSLTPSATPSVTPSLTAPATATAPEDAFGFLRLGTHYRDLDDDPETPPSAEFTISHEGWRGFLGAFKTLSGPRGEGRYLAMNIANITNLVVDGCLVHRAQSPAVGPTVDDLASALTKLEPFLVHSEPRAVTRWGYSGKHVALTLPDLEYRVLESHEVPGGSSRAYWTTCQDTKIKSWIDPRLSFAYYGYMGPQQIEEFWILDVEGQRVVVEHTYFQSMPAADLAEMDEVLNSIVIEP